MVKKGKKKKKKKAAVETAVTDAAAGSADELNIEGEGAQLGIGKKKKPKKKKLTKEEKLAAKLAKQLQSFQEDEKTYTIFWHKMHKWMQDHAKSVISTFKHLDPEEEGCVPFQIFKSGLRDLGCPVTDIELYALSKLLDPENTGGIDYTNFKAGMRQPLAASDSEEDHDLLPEDYQPKVMSSKEKISIQTFGDPFNIKYPRYIRLDMKLKDFVAVSKHPGHFQLTVQNHLTVRGLINKISDCTEITSGQLRIYAGKECTQEECLHPRMSLEECGFDGGPHWSPQRGVLYYDYFVEYDDCPLLNCDFYFGNYAKPHNPVLKAYPDYEERLARKNRPNTQEDDSDF
uniref:uncharacterized protein LOC120328108 n=1 Tax=Styela clava TaxID=7725 RepID=UPI001939B95A|nr:uncharacterized protein LOC120328108 [Styela clava]